jgi:hypothetical protein
MLNDPPGFRCALITKGTEQNSCDIACHLKTHADCVERSIDFFTFQNAAVASY